MRFSVSKRGPPETVEMPFILSNPEEEKFLLWSLEGFKLFQKFLDFSIVEDNYRSIFASNNFEKLKKRSPLPYKMIFLIFDDQLTFFSDPSLEFTRAKSQVL